MRNMSSDEPEWAWWDSHTSHRHCGFPDYGKQISPTESSSNDGTFWFVLLQVQIYSIYNDPALQFHFADSWAKTEKERSVYRYYIRARWKQPVERGLRDRDQQVIVFTAPKAGF
jgi:hypothetical protein